MNFIKEEEERRIPLSHVHTLRKGRVRTHEKTNQERNSHQKPTLPDLDLGLPASRILRSKFLLFQSSSLRYFVMAAPKD